MEMAMTMGFDVVLIEKPPQGLRERMGSGTYNIFEPEKKTRYGKERELRVLFTINKEAEREKYIVEEQNDLSRGGPGIQVFDMYEKLWKEERIEEEERGEKASWQKGRKMRLMNIHDQKLNGNLISKRRYIMELDNWEDIIDDRTILVGNSHIHNPIWGSLEIKNSAHMIKLT
jgi:hypothetical protein